MDRITGIYRMGFLGLSWVLFGQDYKITGFTG